MNTVVDNTRMIAMKTLTKSKILPWVFCAAGALFYSYEYFLRISPTVMTAELMRHYQVNASAFGIMLGFYYYAYVPMQLPVGVLMDRFGPRRLLVFACLVCVLGAYLFVDSQHYMVGSLGRLFVGFGSAFAFVGVLKLATIWLPPNRMALVAGLAAALGTIGGMFGDLSLTALMNRVGWQNTLYIAAFAGLVIAIIIWLVIQENPEAARERKVAAKSGGMTKNLQDLAIILKEPQIWINGLYGCFVYLPTTVFAEGWGIAYLKNAHQFTPDEAAWGISVLFIGFTFGAPFAGWISDKIRRRRLPMLIGATGAAIFSFMLIYMPGISKEAIFFVLFGMGLMYGSQAIVFAVGRENSPAEAAGTAMAATNMIVMLGGIVVQPLVGFLLDYTWSGGLIAGIHVYTAQDFQFALSVMPFGIAIAVVMALFLKETHATLQNHHQ